MGKFTPCYANINQKKARLPVLVSIHQQYITILNEQEWHQSCKTYEQKDCEKLREKDKSTSIVGDANTAHPTIWQLNRKISEGREELNNTLSQQDQTNVEWTPHPTTTDTFSFQVPTEHRQDRPSPGSWNKPQQIKNNRKCSIFSSTMESN